jgi:hypothetical protein
MKALGNIVFGCFSKDNNQILVLYYYRTGVPVRYIYRVLVPSVPAP